MNSSSNSLLRHFTQRGEESPEKQAIRTVYHSFANTLDQQLSESAEKAVALRKLLESMDACLRAIDDAAITDSKKAHPTCFPNGSMDPKPVPLNDLENRVLMNLMARAAQDFN